MNSGGGYTAGVVQNVPANTTWHNGKFEPKPSNNGITGSGGSYYFDAMYDESWGEGGNIAGKVGGQGGNFVLMQNDGTKDGYWWADSGGDGGKAGNGGDIRVSTKAQIFAFNGNSYTDGTDYENGKNQTQIFAQNGILRAVYKLNSYWGEKENYNSSYFKKILGSDMETSVNDIKIANKCSELKNNLIRKEIVESESRTIKCGYQNSMTGDCYGIGSGAGYIEVSNGTFGLIENS